MKNQINSKSVLLQSMFVAGALFLTTSCSENKASDAKELARQENIERQGHDDRTIAVVNNDLDAEFMMDVAEMQLEEISLGQLAQQKGTISHVKELGRMMEEDHTRTFGELKALALSKSVAIPTSVSEDSKSVYRKLNERSGNDFSKAYSDMMVKHHEDAIEMFERTATESEDPDIRSWASKQLPGLRKHLKHAETCKKESDKLKS